MITIICHLILLSSIDLKMFLSRCDHMLFYQWRGHKSDTLPVRATVPLLCSYVLSISFCLNFCIRSFDFDLWFIILSVESLIVNNHFLVIFIFIKLWLYQLTHFIFETIELLIGLWCSCGVRIILMFIS